MLFMTTVLWRPAHDVLEEDDLDWESQEEIVHEDTPFQEAKHIYSTYVCPNGMPTPLFPVKDFTMEQWKSEQRLRILAPIGERVLIRRRLHDSVTFGTVIQDSMMVRVKEPHQWDCLHVFYREGEVSPFPLVNKRNY